MNTYHVFSIKKEAYNIYKNKPDTLYKTLYNLYNFNKTDLRLGISIYNELCYKININKLKEYIDLMPIKRYVKNKYLINKNIVIIKPSNIIIKANKLNKDIIYILNNYYSYLFACDFKTKKYYWLDDI